MKSSLDISVTNPRTSLRSVPETFNTKVSANNVKLPFNWTRTASVCTSFGERVCTFDELCINQASGAFSPPRDGARDWSNNTCPFSSAYVPVAQS